MSKRLAFAGAAVAALAFVATAAGGYAAGQHTGAHAVHAAHLVNGTIFGGEKYLTGAYAVIADGALSDADCTSTATRDGYDAALAQIAVVRNAPMKGATLCLVPLPVARGSVASQPGFGE